MLAWYPLSPGLPASQAVSLPAGAHSTTGSYAFGDVQILEAYLNRGIDASGQRKSVKYLTCWYWQHGGCRKTEAECLYSHHDTGIYADRPRPLRPGGPVVAGKNALLAFPNRQVPQHSTSMFPVSTSPQPLIMNAAVPYGSVEVALTNLLSVPISGYANYGLTPGAFQTTDEPLLRPTSRSTVPNATHPNNAEAPIYMWETPRGARSSTRGGQNMQNASTSAAAMQTPSPVSDQASTSHETVSPTLATQSPAKDPSGASLASKLVTAYRVTREQPERNPLATMHHRSTSHNEFPRTHLPKGLSISPWVTTGVHR